MRILTLYPKWLMFLVNINAKKAFPPKGDPSLCVFGTMKMFFARKCTGKTQKSPLNFSGTMRPFLNKNVFEAILQFSANLKCFAKMKGPHSVFGTIWLLEDVFQREIFDNENFPKFSTLFLSFLITKTVFQALRVTSLVIFWFFGTDVSFLYSF